MSMTSGARCYSIEGTRSEMVELNHFLSSALREFLIKANGIDHNVETSLDESSLPIIALA
jgi:hypothetical protein